MINSQHTVFAFDRQLLLAELLGDLDWSYDRESAVLSFGTKFRFAAEILGTESEEGQTWLWAWANDASNIPTAQQGAALKLKAISEAQGIAELTEPALPLECIDGHALASIAVGEGLGKAYYRGPYPGGAVFLLITDTALQWQVEQPLLRILSVFPQALSEIELPDHRQAFLDYVRHYNLQPQMDGPSLVLRHAGECLHAMFDAHGRLIELRGALGTETPHAAS